MHGSIGQVRTIHPTVIEVLGLEAATALLKVAEALRSGFIKPHLYDQSRVGPYTKFGAAFFKQVESCGTPCCIYGWAKAFSSKESYEIISASWHGVYKDGTSMPLFRENKHTTVRDRLRILFAGGYPNDPELAANAIEAFVYDFAESPWGERDKSWG